MFTQDVIKSAEELVEVYAVNKQALFQYDDPKGIAQNTLIGGLGGAGLGALIGFLRERASTDPEATGLDSASLRTILTSALLGAAGGSGVGFLASDRSANDITKLSANTPEDLDFTQSLGDPNFSPAAVPLLDYTVEDNNISVDIISKMISTDPSVAKSEEYLVQVTSSVANDIEEALKSGTASGP
jgi:hypothetical protein